MTSLTERKQDHSKDNKIYDELKKIQSTHISQKGKEFSRQFKKQCINGFLNQQNLKKELTIKLNKEKMKEVWPLCKQTVEFEIMQLINSNNYNQSHFNFDQSINEMLNNLTKQNIQRELRKRKLEKQFSSISSYSAGKYQVNPELLHYIHLINHKKPPSCMYNPKYSAIAPHVPCVKILKKDKLPSLSFNTKDKLTQCPITYCSRNFREYKTKENIDSYKHVMSFEKYSSRDNIFVKRTYKDSLLDPSKFRANISVPNFKKMSSRHKSRNEDIIPAVHDYHPNYSYFYENKFGSNKDNNPKLKIRKNILRKVLNWNISSSQYLAFPELNKKS